MKKTKLVATLLGILFLTIFSVIFINVFIKNSNDHLECSNEVSASINSKSEKVETKKHICKEKYSF